MKPFNKMIIDGLSVRVKFQGVLTLFCFVLIGQKIYADPYQIIDH